MSRSLPASDPVRVRFAEFDLDEANATLSREGRNVALAPTPFALLCALARRPGLLLTKDALLDSVWGHQFVSESVLKTAISDLRTILGDDPRQPRIIETVPRRGYRFIAGLAPAAIPRQQLHVQPLVPMPVTLDPAFIGRGPALQRLARSWDAARGGRRSIVWIAGEPGIGKTTLIDHFTATLGAVACARGQCLESHGAGEQYLPVLEALGSLCRADAALPDTLRAVAPTWLLQLPWLCTAEERDALRRELAGVGPERMVREFGELLDRYAAEQPLLLVTEDLHWSDRATIQLIDFMARRRGRARVMWLASFRLAEAVALDHPLNAVRRELRMHALCEEIVLDPFSEAEVAAYVAGRSPGRAPDETFVRGLHERTDGVPLFVASVLQEAEARTQQGAGSAQSLQVGSIGIPENLVAIIDHSIARLAGESRELLSAAAACGTEFRAATVAHMLQREADDVAHAFDEMVREQLWLASPRSLPAAGVAPYSFRHSLFRQVLYERMAPSARAQLHARAGAALEHERSSGVPVSAAELATQFDRGRQFPVAVRHYVEAAQASLEQLGSEGALALTVRASALVDQMSAGPGRDELDVGVHTLRGVSAFHALGMGLEARAAFQRAYDLLDRQPRHPMRGQLVHGLGYLLSLRAEYDTALAVAERALSLPQSAEDPALQLGASIIHAEVDLLQGRPRAACNWAERGLAAAAAAPPSASDLTSVADSQVTLLGMLGMELVQLGEVEQARARLDEAHQRARQLRQPMTRLVALWHDALFSVRLGDPGRVAEMAEAMDALVDEFALAQGAAARRWFRGWADARRGRALEGYRAIRDAYEENTRLGMLSGGSEVLGYAAEALLRAGDLEGAERELEQALQVARRQAERVYLPQLHLLQAAIFQERGQPEVARAAGQRSVDEARAQHAPGLELLALAGLSEYGLATEQDRRAALALADRVPQARSLTALVRVRAAATSPPPA